MGGFVTHWPWYALAVAYFMCVMYFAVGAMFDGEEWWRPFVLPVVVPCWWVYENRIGLGVALVIIAALIGVPVILTKVLS
ncbi:MAG: hypothetical protein K0R43_662 [Pseudoduganella sp.]|jgi:hypothetical protein|nr:hypothetical protein [Pseudoduganella sp.]